MVGSRTLRHDAALHVLAERGGVIEDDERHLCQLHTRRRLDLWLRGVHNDSDVVRNFDWIGVGDLHVDSLHEGATIAASSASVSAIRAQVYMDCRAGDCTGRTPRHQEEAPPSRSWVTKVGRGGGPDDLSRPRGVGDVETKLADLTRTLGPDFEAALLRNQNEHDEDCHKSCELYYCYEDDYDEVKNSSSIPLSTSDFDSYSMGAVPPEDFANDFGHFPFDLIKVSKRRLFSQEELELVIRSAQEEGLDHHEFPSGKYRLGGNWLDELSNTRTWFNHQLKSVVFPALAALFPEIVSSPRVLRAHSVSLLKYNASHPRTDVHIDNGILALTIAMSPQQNYEGGGTYFEHMDHVLPMEAGHATFRPGSVRHGGHKVVSGTRYVLGCFLLLQDKVEHVRRLKNRGSDLRRAGDLDGALKHFEWALAINPRCTTCLKDAAEVMIQRGRFVQAESMLRSALELLENKDSDAIFSLGLVLSEQGRHDESVGVYRQGLKLNGDDAELCYNLAVKIGAMGKATEERELYERAVQIDPEMGGAWLNWGTALAEMGDLASAEAKFLRAIECRGGGRDDQAAISAKAMMNLSLLYHKLGESSAQGGNLETAREMASKAGRFADDAKSRLDAIFQSTGSIQPELDQYRRQYPSLRVRCHRLTGQLLAASGSLAESEAEFAKATESFPDDPMAWMMLSRVQQLQGNEAGARHSMARATSLQQK